MMSNLNKLIKQHLMVIAYFSTPSCGVCIALRPKIEKLLHDRFPKIHFEYIDATTKPATAAENNVFAAPVIIVFADGKESIRKSRNLSIEEFSKELERIYTLLFNL